jgi:lipopolysaccharide/colanic/teichoic acid biosynthesis glycosyltransferase
MGTVTKLVKRTPFSWWTRESTKGGSLPKSGRQRRALSDRLFTRGKAQPRPKPEPHLASRIIPLPSSDGPLGPSADSPRVGCHDTVSLLLRDALVQRLGAERAAREAGLTKGLAAAPQPEVSSAALQAASLESAEPAGQLLMRMPGWKRALDLTLVAVTCPIWLPLMLFIMAAIRISSPGPIFYRQERVGFRGRPFMIFKFRSMKVHAQTSWHELHFERLMRGGAPMTKLDAGDPRIIPWGRVLRAMGLDELPQLFNVLRGEMSLVGPRPCTRLEFERYEDWQRERVNAPPGLTGYWQVNGKNRTTFQQMIEMDLFYAKSASIRLDLWIMVKTPFALFEQVLELVKKRAVKLAKVNAGPQIVLARQQNGDRAI